MPQKSRKSNSNSKSKIGLTKKTNLEFQSDDEDMLYNSEDEYPQKQNKPRKPLKKQKGGVKEGADEKINVEGDVYEEDVNEEISERDADRDPDDELSTGESEPDEIDPADESEKFVDSAEEDAQSEEEEQMEDEAEELEDAVDGDLAEDQGDGDGDGDAIDGDEEAFVGEAKVCHYKNLKKDFVIMDDDDSTIYANLEYRKIPTEERDTDDIMTYYEMVRIIGTRAQQFNFGSKPLIEGVTALHPAKMAYLELMAGMTPFIIRRHLPNKKYEEWKISELRLIHMIDDEFFVPENFDMSNITKTREKHVSEILEIKTNSSKSPLGKKSKEN